MRLVLRGSIVYILVVVVASTFARKVGRTFVLVCAAIVLEAANGLIDVARGELIELLVVTEDDDSDVDGAEDAELVGLFEETTLSLEKSH